MGWLQPPGGEHSPEHLADQETWDLLEYAFVHEMLHLVEPTHSECVVA